MNLTDIFLQMLVMGYTALVSATIICLASCLFKALKVPTYIYWVMWLVVIFRLLSPVSFAASFSPFHLPYIDDRLKNAQQLGDKYIDIGTAYVEGMPEYDRAVAAGAQPRDTDIGLKAVYMAKDGITPATTARDAGLPYVLPGWLMGVALIWLYAGISYYLLQRKLLRAVWVEENIYECAAIKTPFVLGFLKPRIYLPCGLEGQQREFILLHERTHIARHDHWLKPAVFMLWSLFWYNYIGWCALRTFEEQLEMSCDELVIRKLGPQAKADYCQALLDYAIRFLGVCPVAFGEVGTKVRIKNVMRYQEPTKLSTFVALAACVAVCVFCLANPLV